MPSTERTPPTSASEWIENKNQRTYHLDVGEADLADTILLFGDPERVSRAEASIEHIKVRRQHREFVTVTGSYHGTPVSLVGTGIGSDNTEIAVIEICGVKKQPTFIRCGSCGTLKHDIALGELIISQSALRLENTSTYFVHEGFPATAHHEVILAMIEACQAKNLAYHVGMTATAPGFYGAQARENSTFPPRFPGLADDLKRMGIANFEMESSTLFTLASLAGCRAGTVCAVYANREQKSFIDEESAKQAEANCIEIGLQTARILAEFDSTRQKTGAMHWSRQL